MIYYKFLKYEETPSEKHLGIATVQLCLPVQAGTPEEPVIYNFKMILRYKISKAKDGTGYFVTYASYKMPGDVYLQAFMLDSNSEKEEVENLIRANVKKFINPTPSLAAPPAPAPCYYTQAIPAPKPADDESLPF